MKYWQKEERNLEILSHIIDIYVRTAVPVSSKAVTEHMSNRVSSATVRNVMAELEEKGYIEQPHTSSGRVPTDLGYRFYVNCIKDQLRLEKERAQRLAGEYTDRIRSISDIIEVTSLLISRELHCAGIVMWPSIDKLYLKHLELIKLKAENVLAVLITMTNAVKNYIVRIDRDIERTELESVANFINSNFEETNIGQIPAAIRDGLAGKYKDTRVIELAKASLEIVDSLVGEDIERDIYWAGLDSFVEEPSARDVALIRGVLQALSDKHEIAELMREELPYKGLRVYIGRENKPPLLKRCSFITSGYNLHGDTVGRIGVIGPTRIDYCNVLKTVICLSDILSRKLEEIRK